MATTTVTLMTTRGWHLTYSQGTSNKFYDVFLSENGYVVMHWGRIGSKGQCKVEKMSSEHAHDVAMRQVYAKASKGYKYIVQDFTFQVDQAELQRAADTQSVDRLQKAFATARTDGVYRGQQELVYRHYDTFTEEAKRLMDRVADLDIGEVMDEWGQLQAAFEQIQERHDATLTTLKLTEQMVTKKLMGL